MLFESWGMPKSWNQVGLRSILKSSDILKVARRDERGVIWKTDLKS